MTTAKQSKLTNGNGVSRTAATSAVPDSSTCKCPTCDSPISRGLYEQILRISEARESQLAKERAVLDRERIKLERERGDIAAKAIVSEQAKHEATVRTLKAEIRKRGSAEKQVARAVAAERRRTKAENDARVRETKRALQQQNAQVIDGLREQLKTVEQRRRRDEDSLKQTIVELQRKSEARDRAHFGPEGEEQLVSVLREQFPGDRIEHHGKNGDVLHVVVDAGQIAGTVVFEVKKRKIWDRSYVRQLKAAMESHGTRYGVLVSRVLPGRHNGICVLNGVIVTVPALAAQVVAVLRGGIVGMSRLRLSEDGRAAKTAALFDYLRGEEFSTAINRTTERVNELRESLSRERSHHDGWWRSREQHYAAIVRDASGIGERVREILEARPLMPTRAKLLAANVVER